MLALVVVDTVMVALLAVLVVGLLRSHADIVRALHSLGVGLGDPAGGEVPGGEAPGRQRRPDGALAADLPVGPPLPAERRSGAAFDVAGTTPEGDGVAVALTGVEHDTLLAFLSSGCLSCAAFWDSLRRGAGPGGLPGTDLVGIRLVAVTRGPELDQPAEVRRRAGTDLTVVMSSTAWDDYEVPGAPFFVLVDGPAGRRVGEGSAAHFDQVLHMVADARAESGPRRADDDTRPGDDPRREARNDHALRAAGILPGDRSLYPSSLADVLGPPGTAARSATGRATPPS